MSAAPEPLDNRADAHDEHLSLRAGLPDVRAMAGIELRSPRSELLERIAEIDDRIMSDIKQLTASLAAVLKAIHLIRAGLRPGMRVRFQRPRPILTSRVVLLILLTAAAGFVSGFRPSHDPSVAIDHDLPVDPPSDTR